MYDILIIGSGPAGMSAAINARARNKSAAVISNPRKDSGLYKARVVDNYPALPGISGSELSCKLTAHAQGLGAEIIPGRVTSALTLKNSVSVSYGTQTASARALIIAVGTVTDGVFPGETEFLGRGVSYCATCDGMLYRGRNVVVVPIAPDAGEETEHLRRIGCHVTEVKSENIIINGRDTVVSVTDGETEIPCDAVFILRSSVAPATLLPGLDVCDGFIVTNRDMSTNLPGVFAAGDCTGAPLQIAKACGEGQIAALSACRYIDGIIKDDNL